MYKEVQVYNYRPVSSVTEHEKVIKECYLENNVKNLVELICDEKRLENACKEEYEKEEKQENALILPLGRLTSEQIFSGSKVNFVFN